MLVQNVLTYLLQNYKTDGFKLEQQALFLIFYNMIKANKAVITLV